MDKSFFIFLFRLARKFNSQNCLNQKKDENWSGFETICKQGIFVKTDLTIKCQKGETTKYNGYHTQIIIFI